MSAAPFSPCSTPSWLRQARNPSASLPQADGDALCARARLAVTRLWLQQFNRIVVRAIAYWQRGFVSLCRLVSQDWFYEMRFAGLKDGLQSGLLKICRLPAQPTALRYSQSSKFILLAFFSLRYSVYCTAGCCRNDFTSVWHATPRQRTTQWRRRQSMLPQANWLQPPTQSVEMIK